MVASTRRMLFGMNFSGTVRAIALQPWFVDGYCADSADAIDASSARDRARSTPGFSPPRVKKYRESRASVAASGPRGIHTFSVSGKLNRGGITLMTVCGLPLTV